MLAPGTRMSSSRRLLTAMAVAIGMLCVAESAKADFYEIRLFREFSGSGTLNGSAENPYATILFEQDGSNLEVTVTALDNAAPDYGKISDLYFNLTQGGTSGTATGFTVLTGDVTAPAITFNNRDNPTADTSFKADGDGFFDVRISLASGGSGAFNPGESFSFVLGGIPGLTLNSIVDVSQGGPVGKNGFLGAAHIQGFSNDGSGWYEGDVYDDDGNVVSSVPEPTGILLALFGVANMGLVVRRFRRKSEVAAA